MKTLAERLRYAMEVLPPKKIKGISLAEAVGVKPPSVSDWLSGKSKTMEGENLLRASKFLGVNPSWLASGIGKPGLNSGQSNQASIRVKKAPVLTWAQAGNWAGFQSIDLSNVEERLALPDDKYHNCFYLKVQGGSNYPIFCEGDYVLVDPDAQLTDIQSGDMVIVRAFDTVSLKKLTIETDGTQYLQALNAEFKPNFIQFDEHCHYIGQVIECFRYIYRTHSRAKIVNTYDLT